MLVVDALGDDDVAAVVVVVVDNGFVRAGIAYAVAVA